MADQRTERFELDATGTKLARVVTQRGGKTYAHTCGRQTFEAVAAWLDDADDLGEPFTTQDIISDTRKPQSQVSVAVALLKERGLLEETECRRPHGLRVNSPSIYEDALIEFEAIIAGCPPEYRPAP